jgi:hypothetical protein
MDGITPTLVASLGATFASAMVADLVGLFANMRFASKERHNWLARSVAQ